MSIWHFQGSSIFIRSTNQQVMVILIVAMAIELSKAISLGTKLVMAINNKNKHFFFKTRDVTDKGSSARIDKKKKINHNNYFGKKNTNMLEIVLRCC